LGLFTELDIIFLRFCWKVLLPSSDLEEIDPNLDEKTIKGLIKRHNKQLNQVKGAELREGNLRYVSAHDAFLVKADLENDNLQKAGLRFANLQEANLTYTNVQFSIFFKAKGLKIDQIKEAKNWRKALYDPKFMNAWPEDDRNSYITTLPYWLSHAVDIHLKHLSENKKKIQLNRWYCLYNLSKCKKPENKNNSSQKFSSPSSEVEGR